MIIAAIWAVAGTCMALSADIADNNASKWLFGISAALDFILAGFNLR